MFLIRKLHKWFGLILGLQFVLWAVSGVGMSLIDHHKVAGDDAILEQAVPGMPAKLLPLAHVPHMVGAPITKLELKPLYDTYVYAATTPQGLKMIDAASGAAVVVDEAKARQVAVSSYAGEAPVKSVTRVEKPTLETRDVALPAWRVEFADKDRTTLLLSAESGQVYGAKNDSWRLWDVFWMLHIMDYDDRQSFNHPLIILIATGAAWITLSGVILLFRSFRRQDFAWVLDPLEKLQEARKVRRGAS